MLKKIITLSTLLIIFAVCSYATSYNSSTIIDAVRQNDISVVRECLLKGISPNTQDNTGYPILLTAISMGFSDIACMLIRNGANVNVAYNMGMNSLMLAINKNMEEVAKMLIDYNVDLNVKLPNGMTALMMASEKGMLNLVKSMVSKK